MGDIIEGEDEGERLHIRIHPWLDQTDLITRIEEATLTL